MGARHRPEVLVLSKVRAGRHLYYLEPTGRTGGPAREPPGQWVGAGSLAGGLGGPVEAAPLEALLEGGDPRTGEPWGADRRRVTVAAYDLSFCAPKSVSILHGLADGDVRDAVGRAHDGAVAAALGYVEDHALAVRRRTGHGGRAVLPATPAPAAVFLHRTSRADDPHLHSHVLVANIGRGPAGDVSALDGRGLYAHRVTTDALYHAQLRHDLTAALGVAWGPLERGRGEIVGVGAEVRRAFSRRSAAIAAHLADRGLAEKGAASRRATTVAFFATRAEKNLAVSVEDLRCEWRERARALGLGPARLAGLLDQAPARAREEGLAAVEGAVLAALGADGPGTGNGARTVTRREVVRAWAAAMGPGAPAAEVGRAADRLLGGLARAEPSAPGGERWPDGPGVAEARHRLPDNLAVDRSWRRDDLGDRRELEQHLARRAMTLAAHRGRGRDDGLGVGLGW